MKKLFALLLALVLVVSLVPVAAHADELGCADGVHTWATTGFNIGKCSICYAKCPHPAEKRVTNIQNCEKPGAYNNVICSDCKFIISQDKVPGKHTFVNGVCTLCSAAEKVSCDHTWDMETGRCTKCYAEHDHEIVINYGLCTDKNAYETEYCPGCKASFNKKPVSGSHNMVNGVCTKCKYEEVECDHEWKAASDLCTKCGYQCKHEEDEIIRANCVDTTKRSTRRCAECHYILELIDVPGAHTMVGDKCSLCGYKEDPNCVHDWDVTKGICNKCGKECKHVETEVIYGKCDDTTTYNNTRCKECHKSLKKEPVSGKHDMKDGKCTRCGYEEKPDCKHNWDWTTGFCKICGAACDHKNGTEVVYGNCVNPNAHNTTRCVDCLKVMKTEPVSGKHDMGEDGVCKKCGYKENADCKHEWDRETGLCKKCGKECEHLVAKWHYQFCGGAGYNTKMCENCLKVLEITDVFENHTFQEGVCIYCGFKDPNYVPPTKPTDPTDPDDDFDDVPETGDNALAVMTTMVGAALLSAVVYFFTKKKKAC